jgi:hypothetical protein
MLLPITSLVDCRNSARLRAFTSAMMREIHELSESDLRELRERLTIPAGEFVAVFVGALLTLGLLFGPAALTNAARHVVFASAGAISGTFAQIGTIGGRVEAKPVDAKPAEAALSEKASEPHRTAPPR